MRPALAIMLAVFFAIIFVVALLVSRVVNTAGEPGEIAGLIEDADIYDFVYDRMLDAVLADVTAKGLTVDTGLNDSETLQFEDPAQAQAAIKGFIETVFPREYVKLKIDESLHGVIPYVSGRSDSFEVNLETGERIGAVPEAVRVASQRIGLGELVVTEVVVPTVRDLSGSITNEALGIELTPDEAEDAARRILPPEWIETQLFSFADQTAPYFAGTEDDLNIVITFKDRVPVAGQILKDKLNDEDTLVRLVFDQVVDPLVDQLVSDQNVIAFGIEITDDDVQEAVEIVAPADWVRAQGDGVIDAVVAWLVGATDTLEYTFDLSERKPEVTMQLEALALRKLDEQVAATPVCQNAFDSAAALEGALRGVFPACLPANSSEVLDVMRPLISNEINALLTNSLPDQITYSDADLRAQLGADSLDTLDSLRETVIDGFTFTDDDLVEMLAGTDASPEAIADAREILDLVRAGFVFNETEITDRLDAASLVEFNNARDLVGMGWSFRWVIFLPAILLLVLIAFVGGGGWPGRAKWAGAPVAVVSILFFVSIQVGWASTAPLREEYIPTASLSEQNRTDFPKLAAIVDGRELQNMLERVGSSWMSGLAMSAAPWAVGGLVLFGIGYAYPKYRTRLPQFAGGPRSDRAGSDTWNDSGDDRKPIDAISQPETMRSGEPSESEDQEKAGSQPGEAA